MGWPLRGGKQLPRVRRQLHLPDGREPRRRSAWSSASTPTDATLSVHDLLQELKTHPKVGRILDGGERVAWGAKTIPEGGFLALPDRLHFPGGMIVGDGAGLVNVPALKGIHYAMTLGDARRRDRRRRGRAGRRRRGRRARSRATTGRCARATSGAT